MVFYNGFNLLVDIILVSATWYITRAYITAQLRDDYEYQERS